MLTGPLSPALCALQVVNKGRQALSGGTSQSSPIFGAVVSLLLQSFKNITGKPFGFINPLLSVDTHHNTHTHQSNSRSGAQRSSLRWCVCCASGIKCIPTSPIHSPTWSLVITCVLSKDAPERARGGMRLRDGIPSVTTQHSTRRRLPALHPHQATLPPYRWVSSNLSVFVCAAQVTGLGTPNYANMVSYIGQVAQKTVQRKAAAAAKSANAAARVATTTMTE